MLLTKMFVKYFFVSSAIVMVDMHLGSLPRLELNQSTVSMCSRLCAFYN